MAYPNDSKILIVDDDPTTCDILQDLLSSWNMVADQTTQPLSVQAMLNKQSYAVVLLDIWMPGVKGLDLIPMIREHTPGIKVIVSTGQADKNTAIVALRSGAFDYLEKPVEPEILYHSISRALETRKKELELNELVLELKHRQAELLAQRERLEFLNVQLLETNRALAILAQNFERERDEIEKSIGLKLKSIIIPSIERLMMDKSLARHELEFKLLIAQIDDLTSGFTVDLQVASNLSYTEMKIASLVKNGLSTEQIAQQLNIAISTVRSHRRNIRKKLKLNNSAYNLRNYLTSVAQGIHPREMNALHPILSNNHRGLEKREKQFLKAISVENPSLS